jgi:DNA-binding MarR family transcriptional regulator
VSVEREREELIQRIVESQRDLGKVFAQHQPLLDSNLTLRQLQVLLILSQSGSVSGQDLSQQLHIGLGTVTGIVDRLVGHGLVSRHEDPNDRRVRRIHLTEDGKQAIGAFSDTGMRYFRLLMEHLDTGMLRTIAETSSHILAIAENIDFEGSDVPKPRTFTK